MLMGGELFNAPIKNPQKVLDLGTGTGNWAIDFAEYDSLLRQHVYASNTY